MDISGKAGEIQNKLVVLYWCQTLTFNNYALVMWDVNIKEKLNEGYKKTLLSLQLFCKSKIISP